MRVTLDILITLIVIGFYFFPTFVVLVRKRRPPGPVIVIDLFLGWTVIGWVVALAMAFG